MANDIMGSEKYDTFASNSLLDESNLLQTAHSTNDMSKVATTSSKLKLPSLTHIGGKWHQYHHPSTNSNQSLSEFQDDWSKESLEQFFQPIESFLDKQLKRERSSKRRCKEIMRRRQLENARDSVENKLREFDHKICLDVLMKSRSGAASFGSKSKSLNSLTAPGASNSSQNLNYRQLIANEHADHHKSCSRCLFFNNCYEENVFDGFVNQTKSKNPNNYHHHHHHKIKKYRRSTVRLPKLTDQQQQQQQPQRAQFQPPPQQQQLRNITKQTSLASSLMNFSSSDFVNSSNLNSKFTVSSYFK